MWFDPGAGEGEPVAEFATEPANCLLPLAGRTLVGAVLSDQHDEWAVGDRRYVSEGSMALIDTGDQDDQPKQVTTANQHRLPAA